MSKLWYPMINHSKCVGCMACYNKCKHGVFTIEKDKPKVVYRPDFIIFHSLKIMAIDFQAITKKQRLFWVNRPLFFVPLRYVYT